MADCYDIRLPALAIQQGDRWIYAFGVSGRSLETFATVSRAHRDSAATLHGYQRPEVASHIRSIRRYIESDGALLPNAVVLAFRSSVTFEPNASQLGDTTSLVPGELVIPVDEAMPESDMPAWIVDGQQRCAAIRDSDIDRFYIAAVGFIASSDEEQRSQFILVNNTKPLPKGLIHELLPSTSGKLPTLYARRRLPAQLMERLNNDPRSPFFQVIATPTNPIGHIKDNSVLKMIENSLHEGVLYNYRDSVTGEGEVERMLQVLDFFWSRVKSTWPLAWRLPPKKSRLSHGVGIQALGYVMDLLNDFERAPHLHIKDVVFHLNNLRHVAAWTEGNWNLSPGDTRPWNGLQNTPNDVRQLTNLFVNTLNSGTL